jgi:flavodoxin
VNTLVVYFSKFGNTKHVAEAIGDALGSRGKVRLIGADQLTPDTMRDVDLVVMGTPTHNMNLPKAVRPILKGLPRRILSKTPVAAFDTSYALHRRAQARPSSPQARWKAHPPARDLSCEGPRRSAL